jgi:hypothetical protein
MNNNSTCAYSQSPDLLINSLRKVVMHELIDGFVRGQNLLEVFNGQNTVEEIFNISALDSYHKIEQKDIITITNKYLSVKKKTAEVRLPDSAERSFSDIVWFNGLNWMKPHQDDCIVHLLDKLTSNGRLHISFAGRSNFCSTSGINHEIDIGNSLRVEAGHMPTHSDFDNKRFDDNEIKKFCKPLNVLRFQKMEVNLNLKDLTQFTEWHEGSVKCLFGDLAPTCRNELKASYISKLYEKYNEGEYSPNLVTCLLNASRI